MQSSKKKQQVVKPSIQVTEKIESLEEAHKIEENPEEYQPIRSKGGDEWTSRVDRHSDIR